MRRTDSCLVPKAGVPVQMTARNRHAVPHPNGSNVGLWQIAPIRSPKGRHSPAQGADPVERSEHGTEPWATKGPFTNPEGVE